MGGEGNPRTTRSTHTLPGEEGEAGGDVLGVTRRHDPTQATRGDKTRSTPSREAMARHQRQRGAVGRRPRMDAQGRVIEALHPVIRGWSPSCATLCRHEPFAPMDAQRRPHRRSWIRRRQPTTTLQWGDQPSWRGEDGQRHVRPRARGTRGGFHPETPMQRHVNVPGRRRPYDGDDVDWGRRRAPPPGGSRRVARRLKRHDGSCPDGGDACHAGDVRAVEHRIPQTHGGSDDAPTGHL